MTVAIADALAGRHGPVATAMRFELRDLSNRYLRDITSAVTASGRFEVDIFREVPSTISGLVLDAARLGEVDFSNHCLAPFVQLGMPLSATMSRSVRTTNSYEEEVLALNPSAYWRMNDLNIGSVRDYSGNGNRGTTVNSPTVQNASLIVATEDGASLDFERTSTQYITVPDDASLDPGNTFSLGIIIRPETTLGIIQKLFDKGSGGYFLDISSAGRVAFGKSGTAVIVNTPSLVLSPGTTYHIFATKSGSTSRIYVNGALASGVASDQTIVSNSDPLRIAANSSNSETFDGLVQEAVIFDYALSATQISNLYAASSVEPAYETVTVQSEQTIEWQLGLFVLGNPVRRQDERTLTYSLDCGDMCERLASHRLDKSYRVRRNQNIYNAVSFLADAAGLRVIMEGAETAVTEPYTWAPGTSFLKVMNDLALSAGCFPFWADRDGVIHTRRVDVHVLTDETRTFEQGSPGGDEFFGSAQPYANAYVNWIGPGPLVEYRTDREPRLVRAPISGAISPEDRANVVVAEGISLTHAVVGNVDQRSHLYPAKLGTRTHERIMTLDISAPTNVLLDQAGWQLILAEAFSETYTLITAIDPRPEGRPYYRVSIDGFRDDEIWMSMGWSFDLSLNGNASHKIARLLRDMRMAAYTVTEFAPGVPFTED